MDLATDNYLLDKSDYEQYKQLFFYSFDVPQDNSEEAFLKKEYKHANVYGLKEDEQLMTSVTCIPFRVNFFGRKFNMAGIGNVMSAPEYLGRDGITNLMKQAFNDMYENKVTLSYLGPFSYDYYRRFGYEQVFESLQIKIPFEKFARYHKNLSGSIKRFKYSEAENNIGDLFNKQNNAGSVIRESWWWKNIPSWYPDDMLAVTYDEAGKTNGYMRYAFKNGDFVIRDIYYKTPDAFLILMHFINKHRSIYQNVVIHSDDTNLKINPFVTNPSDAQITIKPGMMARIVNLRNFMLNYPVQKNELEPIKLSITDYLTWNKHLWQICVRNGAVTFEPIDGITADVTTDIQTLTKALFGYQSLSESYLVSDVSGDVDKIKQLDKIFINKKARLNEFF